MKFKLGRVKATALALDTVGEEQILYYLVRHENGDWGEALSEEDKKLNNRALEEEGRVMSAYFFRGEKVVWIITEWDRRTTTILLPEEY